MLVAFSVSPTTTDAPDGSVSIPCPRMTTTKTMRANQVPAGTSHALKGSSVAVCPWARPAARKRRCARHTPTHTMKPVRPVAL